VDLLEESYFKYRENAATGKEKQCAEKHLPVLD
jgi:hypothetical protein